MPHRRWLGGRESQRDRPEPAVIPCQADRMVTEIADFPVDPERGDAFLDAYRGARHLLLDAGAATVRMSRGVESPGRFVMLVEWPSVAAHESFRARPTFRDWRAAVGPFFASPPTVEHVTFLD